MYDKTFYAQLPIDHQSGSTAKQYFAEILNYQPIRPHIRTPALALHRKPGPLPQSSELDLETRDLQRGTAQDSTGQGD